jgi:tetratricopeptide (TPR) repeat protein
MAADLGPGDFMVSLVTGTLDGEEGKWADSVRHFQRAVLLKKDEVNEVVNLYVGYFHRPDIGLQFADGSINSLRLLAQQLRALGKDQSAGPTTGPATRSSDEAIALQADRRADALVRAAADQKDAPPEILGEMGLLCVRQKDWEQAVSYLGRAELKAPDQMDWRLALARSLLEVGRTEEAVSEAQSILRHRPQWEPAQELIDRATHPAGQRPLDTDELHSHDTAPAEPFINPAFR